MADVITSTAPGVHVIIDGDPVLHAFPPGMNIALCGRVKAERAMTHEGRRCPVCERLATQKWFIGR